MSHEVKKVGKEYAVLFEDRVIAQFPDEWRAHAFIVAPNDRVLFDDVMHLAEKWPALQLRAWKAARLYQVGHVTLINDVYKVLAQTGTKTYTVDRRLAHCSCPDHQNGAPAGPRDRVWCKHKIACVMFFRYHLAPKNAVVVHRGATTVVPMKGNGNSPIYGCGERIDEKDQPFASMYKERNGNWPHNSEKLLSWIWR